MSTPSKLIFLPGGGGNASFWEPVSKQLKHPALQTLLGWPGFGSVAADPLINGIDDLVAKLASEIKEPTALIAQSMGGVIAMQVALMRPDLITHLILTVTSGGIDISDLHTEDWRPAFLKTRPLFPRWFVEYKSDLSAQLGTINVPVLLIWGDADPISPVAVGERLRDLLPRARLHVFPGGTHELANTFASSVVPLIDEHLSLAI